MERRYFYVSHHRSGLSGVEGDAKLRAFYWESHKE